MKSSAHDATHGELRKIAADLKSGKIVFALGNAYPDYQLGKEVAVMVSDLIVSAVSETPTKRLALFDGWIKFESDCIVNGVEVKAGTSWGPFEKSRNANAAPGQRAEVSSLDHSPQESSANVAGNAPGAAPASTPSATRESAWVRVSKQRPAVDPQADDVLTTTITGHVVTAHPNHISARYLDALQHGEDCFYTHWMPLPEAAK